MTREKTTPEILAKRQTLAKQIKHLRTKRFGKSGGPEIARRLGIAPRSWYNYENGTTIPAEILLDFLTITGYTTQDLHPKTEVNLKWLMNQIQQINKAINKGGLYKAQMLMKEIEHINGINEIQEYQELKRSLHCLTELRKY